MAEEFYKASGLLRFNGKPIITPMIESFFGHLNTDLFKVSSDHTVEILDSESMRYEAIAASLNENVMKFGLAADCVMNMDGWMSYFYEKFNVPPNKIFNGELEEIDRLYVQLDELFNIVKLFNDGHNLYSLEFTCASHIDKVYCGGATYLSDRINYQKNASTNLIDAFRFDSCIESNNLEEANEILMRQLKAFTKNLSSNTKMGIYLSLINELQEENKKMILGSDLNKTSTSLKRWGHNP